MMEVVDILVCALVDNPESVEVEEMSQHGTTVHVEVRVAPGDIGKVIGKQGRIANAIRTVANTAAARQNLRAIIDFTS